MSQRKYTDQSLKSIIGEMLKSTGMDRKYTELEIVECYYRTVGNVIANKTLSARVNGKTLYLKFDSAPLRHEISLQKSKLINLINESMGQQLLNEIDLK